MNVFHFAPFALFAESHCRLWLWYEVIVKVKWLFYRVLSNYPRFLFDLLLFLIRLLLRLDL